MSIHNLAYKWGEVMYAVLSILLGTIGWVACVCLYILFWLIVVPLWLLFMLVLFICGKPVTFSYNDKGLSYVREFRRGHPVRYFVTREMNKC